MFNTKEYAYARKSKQESSDRKKDTDRERARNSKLLEL